MVESRLIAVRNMRFRWRPDADVVVDVQTLDVSAGEHLFVQGSSGSGKSSLLGILAGVNLASEGEVRVLGRELGEMSASQRDAFRSDHIGYIFQQFNLVPYLSVLENVLLPLRFSRRRRARVGGSAHAAESEALRLLADVGLAELARRRVTELSVGQQQRVAAARALIGSPELLIADEPTSALDAELRESFIALLFKEAKASGTTVVFVSHDAALADHFKTMLLLESGRPARVSTAGTNGKGASV